MVTARQSESRTDVFLAHSIGVALVAASWVLAAIWISQAVSARRGLRQLPSLLKEGSPSMPEDGISVAVVVPACNEELAIGACLRSLIEQDWPNLKVFAVDDRSIDATGAIMDQLQLEFPERLSVLHVHVLPEGWLGKTHAMALAAEQAIRIAQPRWLLFTDGDVLFHPECLRRALALAESERADHFVTAPTAIVHTTGETILMAFLQVIGLWGARLWRVSDPDSRDAVGIGAFNLLRTSAFEQLGGFDTLRLQILEDLALARLVKNSGLRQRIALAPGFVQVHWASGVRGVLNTMTKNLFAIFRFRVLLMAGACMAIGIMCLGPFIGLFWQQTRLPSLLALLAIASLYRSAAACLSRLSPITFFAFPVSAILFVYAILRSTAVTLLAGGVRWRGTFYPLRELREVAVKLR